jgi:hypothetical protein
MREKEDITQLDKLKVFTDEYYLIRNRLLAKLDIISRDLKIDKENIPPNVLSMISQHIEIALNLFKFYQENIEAIEDELWGRINIQERMVFALTLSCLEYMVKPYYNANKSRIGIIINNRGKEKKNVTLRDIIDLSNSIDVINDNDHELWKGLLELRNCTVHNNSVSSVTKEYIFPPYKSESYFFEELHLNFIEGEAVRSNIWLFPHLINWIIDSIESWIYKIHAYKSN